MSNVWPLAFAAITGVSPAGCAEHGSQSDSGVGSANIQVPSESQGNSTSGPNGTDEGDPRGHTGDDTPAAVHEELEIVFQGDVIVGSAANVIGLQWVDRVEGDVIVEPSFDQEILALPRLRIVAGTMRIESTGIRLLALPRLQEVGNFYVYSNEELTSLVMSPLCLRGVDGRFGEIGFINNAAFPACLANAIANASDCDGPETLVTSVAYNRQWCTCTESDTESGWPVIAACND